MIIRDKPHRGEDNLSIIIIIVVIVIGSEKVVKSQRIKKGPIVQL